MKINNEIIIEVIGKLAIITFLVATALCVLIFSPAIIMSVIDKIEKLPFKKLPKQ